MRSRLTAVGALLVLAVSSQAAAKMRADPVEWSIGQERFSGVLVYDDEDNERRPGLVMVPNWLGVNASAIEKASRIAGDDYVVLVADVYGKGVRPKDNQEAGQVAGALRKDLPALRTRALAAVEALKAQAGKAPLDPSRIGALGFCFGGTTVLELARSGAEVAGVVSLHGGLKTDLPASAKPSASILVLNGAADTYVAPEEIAAFQQEMDKAQADWQFVNYAGAVHCFAEANAASPPGCVYHPLAAKRAFAAMHGFFDEVFSANK